MTGARRAQVFVLWRVLPWQRDAVELYRLDRADGTAAGPFRTSEERWATAQVWPPFTK